MSSPALPRSGWTPRPSRPSWAARPPRTRAQRTAFWGYAATLGFAGACLAAGALYPRPPLAPAARAPAAFAPGLDRAFAVAYHPAGPRPRWVYVACPGRVMRYRVSFDGEVILPAYASSQAPSARSAADKAR